MKPPPAADSAAAPAGGRRLALALAAVFFGGVALNLTPCVYPLLPVTAAYFAGRGDRTRGATLAHGICYVGGLALTNSLLGAAAALSGALLGSALRSPAVTLTVAAIQLALAASLFGLWELRTPAPLQRLAARSFAGLLGSAFMGLTTGLVAAPCIGPFVLGLLTWVAGSGSAALGFAVFLSLSLGLGLPQLGLALAGGSLQRLPRAGAWLVWVRRLLGWALVAAAVRIVRPLLPPDAALAALALAALAGGIDLGWRSRGADSRPARLLQTAVGTLGVLVAVTLAAERLARGPSVRWRPLAAGVLAEARRAGKPVILDFAAAWCAPCERLDAETFRDRRVVALAEEAFVMVKVDLTGRGDALGERLVREHDVKGVPTVVFLGADGREHRALRLVDFLPPEDFLSRMQATQVPP